MKPAFSRAMVLALFGLILTPPLFAQTAVTITNSLGDESAGSFEAGVTYLNANGGGNLFTNLSIAVTSSAVSLSQTLPVGSQGVTLQAGNISAPGVKLLGQTGAPASLVFQNNFTLGNNTNLLLQGGGSNLDAAISAGSFNMSSGSGMGVTAGAGNSIAIAGGSSQTGGAGGSGSLTVAGSINMDSIAGGQLLGGAGGSVSSGGGGASDTGGLGGNVLAQAATWILSDSNYSLAAGNGGNADGTNNILGGQGGGVNVSVNNWAVTNSSGFTMSGGSGGAAVTGTFGGTALTGGAGGAVTVAAGALTVAGGANWFLNGGNGGTGTDTGGLGGAVSVNWNSLNETQGAGVHLNAGNGGNGSQSGGQGGSAAVVGVSIIEAGSSSSLNVSGGTGGGLSSLGGGANAAGNGGGAGMTMTSIQLTAATAMNFSGGAGGNSFSLSQGTGGNGGNASVSIGTIDVEGQSSLNLSGGSGGIGGTSGNGGTALVLANSVTLDTGGNLTLEGGNAGASAGTVGAAGGVGVGFQTAFIGTNASLNLLSGTTGSVVASIANLTGSGSIEETGTNSVLELGSGSFSGTISGTESLADSGAMTLSGDNTYTGGTTVSGALAVDTGGSLGSGGVFVQNSKLLQYLNSASAGNASVTSGGTVDFENASTAGAATFTLVPGGYANFANDSQGGTASFNLAGGSALDVSNSTAGVVTVGSVASTGGSVTLGGADGTALAVGINDLSTTISGIISDTGLGGALIKQGTGVLVLNQLNTYQGGTLLQQGQLEVVDATSLGSGSVSVVGGTLSSMGSAVSLNVGGNYVQGPEGTLQLGLYGANVTGVDWLNVDGSAKLGGTLDLIAGGGLTPMSIGDAVVLISAATSLTGTFQTIQESFGGTMRLLPIYQPGFFEVESIDLSFAAAGQTPNEKAIGVDLDAVYLSPGVQNLMVVLGTQSNVVLKSAYDQLSPEGYSVLYQSAFEGVQLQASEVDDRLAELRDAPQTPAPPTLRRRGASGSREVPLFAGNLSVADEMAMLVHPQADGPSPWGGFFSGNGGVFAVGDTHNAQGFKDTSYGLSAAGADYQISNQLAVGILAGYAESDVSLNGGGSVTETGGQLGVYGTWYPNQFYFNALLEGGLNHYSSQRQSYKGDAGGKTQGFLFSGRLGVGYDLKGSGWVIGPLAALQWTQLSIDGFAEQGPLTSLDIASQTQSSWMSQMGAHAQWCLNLGGIQIRPGAKISWEHEFSYQGGIIQAGFGQGDSFTVEGPAVGQDGFLARGSLDTSFSKQLTVSLGYQGELSRTNLTSTQFDAGMKFGF